MTLILHIIIALSSLVVTGIAYVAPSNIKLRLAYVLVALTVASGSYLIVAKPAHMVAACAEGLVYLAIVMVGIVLARGKLARQFSK
jgi:hypothetical protein